MLVATEQSRVAAEAVFDVGVECEVALGECGASIVLGAVRDAGFAKQAVRERVARTNADAAFDDLFDNADIIKRAIGDGGILTGDNPD